MYHFDISILLRKNKNRLTITPSKTITFLRLKIQVFSLYCFSYRLFQSQRGQLILFDNMSYRLVFYPSVSNSRFINVK